MSRIAAYKTDARRAIHAEMAVAAIHVNEYGSTPTAEQLAAGLTLTVRFATKAKVLSPESDGLSIMENIERLIFIEPELEALDLALAQGDEIHIEEYGFALVLDQPMDPDGPLNVYWTVTRAA